jgi:hypothetical protein
VTKLALRVRSWLNVASGIPGEVKVMKAALFLAAILGGLAAAFPAEAKIARCVVEVEGRLMLNDRCDFRSEASDGSFSLAAVNPRNWLMPGAGTILLQVTRPGLAEVFVVGERSSRWGEARRSKTDEACWIGSKGSFKICAY